MRRCLLTSRPSSAIQLVYYVQTRGIKFDDVVIVGRPGPQYAIFAEYADINHFGLHFVEGVNSDDCLELMRRLRPDIVKIVTTQIVRAPLLAIPSIGVLNTHAAMLPRYRGVDTPAWAILEGGPVGVVEHFVDETIDTGDMVAVRELKLQPGDTVARVLYRNHYENKWQTCADALVMLRDGTAARRPQRPEEGKQYYAMHPKILAIVEERLARLRDVT